MAEYKESWELEIDHIFLSDDLEDIVDRTRAFFRKIKPGTSQEEREIRYWLACAYEHREVNRTPFFPVLFLYAVCSNEKFSDDRLFTYMGYAARYIQDSDGKRQRELQNGWLENHMDQLPGEHQRVALIYLGLTAVCPQIDADRIDADRRTSGGISERAAENICENMSQNIPENTSGKNAGKSSAKGWLIGLIAGLLIGVTLGFAGTALILNSQISVEYEKQEKTPENSSSGPCPGSSQETTPSASPFQSSGDADRQDKNMTN